MDFNHFKFTRFFIFFTARFSEYQSEFGAEAVTQSEVAREWISAMVRPGSKVMRVRVDAMTSAVKAIEHKTLQQLTKDGQPLGFKPAEQLGNLHSVFSRYSCLNSASRIIKQFKHKRRLYSGDRLVHFTRSKTSTCTIQ